MTSQYRAIRSQSQKIVKFVKCELLFFFNYQSTCDSPYVPASIYDRKMNARPFDTTHDILRCLSFVQSLFKDRNTPIWRIADLRVKHYILRILKPCLVKMFNFIFLVLKPYHIYLKFPWQRQKCRKENMRKKGTSVKVWDVLVRSSSV